MFVDFDGTITDRDTFEVLVRRFAGAGAWHASEAGLHDGSVSLRDVLQRQAAYVRGTYAEVAAYLRREVRVDATFAPFVVACRARAISVTVISSGIERIVRERLAEIGVRDVAVIANGIDARPEGWIMRFRDASANGTDKAAVLREAQARGEGTVFVGDGPSDYAAALAADRRCAKAGSALATFLAERGVAVRTFATFAELTFPSERSCLADT